MSSTRPEDSDGAVAPSQQTRQLMFDAAADLLGHRVGENRIDPDGGFRITVLDLTDADTTALRTAAADLGIQEWLRIEAADVTAWNRLRTELIRLQESYPQSLLTYPPTAAAYHRLPAPIQLAAWAEAVARELHEQFGGLVTLTLGSLPYPLGSATPPNFKNAARDARLDEVDPSLLTVELAEPLNVESGHTVTTSLAVTNRSEQTCTFDTTGEVVAEVVDPDGTVVGGYAGWLAWPLITFTAGPGQTVRIPLLVGTASFTPRLGHAVPPGDWALIAPLALSDGRHLRTPPLPFVVTS